MFPHDGEDLCLFLGVRIVYRVVQSAAFLAFHGLLCYQVSYVYHVAQFAQLSGSLAPLEECFCLLVSMSSRFQARVNRVLLRTMLRMLHNLVHFLHALCDEDTFFGGNGTFVVPFGNVFVEVITFQYAQRVFGCRVGINHGSISELLARRLRHAVRCTNIRRWRTGGGCCSVRPNPP